MLLLNSIPLCLSAFYLNFNTSYVVIKHGKKEKMLNKLIISISTVNFNTSYVVIKLSDININNFSSKISIHLMLLLNVIDKLGAVASTHFNTSYVVIKHVHNNQQHTLHLISIHLMLLLN